MICKTKKQLINKIRDYIEEGEPILLADGFEEAFIGMGRQFGKPVAIYHRQKCIKILVKGGMTEEEAEEFFSFNIDGAWVGEQTPIYLDSEPLILNGNN